MKYKVLPILLLICSTTHGQTTYEVNDESKRDDSTFIGVSTSVGYEDDQIIPKGSVPIRWNKNFSSSISYSGQKEVTLGSLINDASSFNAGVTDETRIALGLLTFSDEFSFNQGHYSIGVELERIDINAKERAYYFKMPATKEDFYPAELDRKIIVNRVNLPLSMQWRGDNWTSRFEARISTYSQLELEQNLYLPEYDTNNRENSDKRNQKTAWKLTYESIFTGLSYIAPGYGVSFEELPLEYDSLTVNSSKNVVEIGRVKNKLQTLTAEARLYWQNAGEEKQAKKYIGYRYIESKDANASGSEHYSAFVIGIDERF